MQIKRIAAAVAAASISLCALLTGCSQTAEEASPVRQDTPPPVSDSVFVPETMSFSGTVTGVAKGGQITLDTEQMGEVVCNTDDNTIFVNVVTGRKTDLSALSIGELVSVDTSRAMTRSLPPQTQCYAVICNLPENGLGNAAYVEAAEVSEDADGSLAILNQNEDVIITIPADLPVELYGSDETVPHAEITEGSRLVVWYDAVTLSLPGNAVAQRAVCCPPAQG